MIKIKTILMAGILVLAGALSLSTGVSAADISDPNYNKVCSEITDDDTLRNAAGCDAQGQTVTNNAVNIINVVIGVVGVVAVIMIVMGGQRYVVAAGEPGKIKQAKDMIFYSIIGLVVAILAWAIVNFVSGAITSNANLGQ